MVPTTISRSNIKEMDNKVTRFIYYALFFCLDWIRDEELGPEDEMNIVVRYRRSATINRGSNIISYRPGENAEKIINLSDWDCLEKGGKINIKRWKKLLRRYLPECEISEVRIKDYEAIGLGWPDGFKIVLNKDIDLLDVRKGISPSYSILSVLTEKPDWIASNLCKGSFKDKVIMGFKEKNLIFYEGKGATYIFNENGLEYAQVRSTDVAKESKDLLKYIRHNAGYDNWKKDIIALLSKED